MNTREPLLSEREWQTVACGFKLSGREVRIVRYVVVEEMKESTIARRLGISPNTVHTHLRHLYVKLGVHSRAGAIVEILRGFIERAPQPTFLPYSRECLPANGPAA